MEFSLFGNDLMTFPKLMTVADVFHPQHCVNTPEYYRPTNL